METADSDKIGSIGWCMGGGYSLKTALEVPDLSACVICYGRLITDNDKLKKINCPLLGIFGENDRNITTDNVHEFKNSLNQTGINNKIFIYPGAGHAFMNPGNDALYNKEAASEAWNQIYSFLSRNLKAGD